MTNQGSNPEPAPQGQTYTASRTCPDCTVTFEGSSTVSQGAANASAELKRYNHTCSGAS